MPLPEFIPNYTPPGRNYFHDIFKGKDDEEFLKKVRIMLKYTGIYTFCATTADIVLYSESATLTAGAIRGLYWGVPLIGGGLAYTAMFTTLASLRKKNDNWNHFFAGYAAGAVCGYARKSFTFGLGMGACIGIFGTIYKDSLLRGYEVFPAMDLNKRRFGHPFSHEWDYTDTFTSNRRGWWARSEEDAQKLMEESDFNYNEWVPISQ